VSNMSGTPEVNTVTMACLLKLIELLAAELVVGAHRDDINLVEKSIRQKLHTSVEGVSPEATAEGVALAHSLVEPVLRSLRARAQEAVLPISTSKLN
jgi:hypothetical protein